MKRRFFTLIVPFAFLFTSCKSESNDYKLDKSVQLSEYGLISPFYIEQLTEAPIRQFHGWNDSLLSLCKINTIQIVAHGMKNPDAAAELASFHFTASGQINQYRYFKYELGQEPFTQVNFKTNKAIVTRYFGEKVDQLLEIEKTREGHKQSWIRSNGSSETLYIIGTLQRPVLLLSYSGDRLSKCTVIVNVNDPLRTVAKRLKENGVDQSELLYAEKAVLYVDEKYQPLEMYQFNENFVQTGLLAEWIYENHKKLTAYRRYINGTCVKEFSFNYNDDRLLNSFEYNRIRYSVKYN